MRLLLVTKLSFNPQVIRWIRQLQSDGVTVSCVHIGHHTDTIPGLETIKGARVHHLLDDGYPSNPLHRLIWLIARYRAILVAEKPDIIWALCIWTLLLPLVWVLPNSRRSLVVTVCGSDINVGSRSFRNRLIYRMILHNCALVCTTTLEMMSNVLELARIPVSRRYTRYWGIDTNWFCPATPEERASARQRWSIPASDVVIFTGRIFRPIAYHTELVNALAHLRQSSDLPSFRVVFLNWASDPSIVASVKRQISDAGLDDIAMFIDHLLTEGELRHLYAASDVYLNLLQMDQLGASIFEAMAVGNLVVATDLPQYLRLQEEGLKVFHVRRASVERDLVATLVDVIQRLNEYQCLHVSSNQRIIMPTYEFRTAARSFADTLRNLVDCGKH